MTTSRACVSQALYTQTAKLEKELEIQSIEQVANVATLPGIEIASLAMPDIHTGLRLYHRRGRGL